MARRNTTSRISHGPFSFQIKKMKNETLLQRNVRGSAPADRLPQDYKIRDPPLTDLGHEQCKKLNAHLRDEEPLAGDIEAVICSPMKRTIQTMIEGLDFLLAGEGEGGERKKPSVEFDARWQENSDAPCDTGSPVSALQDEFPQYREGLSRVDPAWPSKTGPYAFTRTATLERGQAVLQALYSRPEKVVAVVSHSGFLRTAVSQSHYANADYRVFDFEEKMAGKEYRLIERDGTREKGGGLGMSWKGWANVEEGDFPEEITNEAREETPPPVPDERLGRV
ncbi:uncharacterized protein PV09_07221 [Verruconis gallopava]|uniref:Phosphoglycerate mutase n=1 Tax=Verruconis gallopava TaxID=253628 RepID=A0A0D2AQN6_9PEZI|nr:uncharacterized protein PV09_07221 [Verruconis gallopava]KIW01464.1 hypothetical protein PV09_07221 [Verruconis gallopava]